MRCAGIYAYGGRLCFLTRCMNWELGLMDCDPCIMLDAEEPDVRFGEALRDVLAASVWDVPRPGRDELEARSTRFLMLIGAHSWHAIGRRGSVCSVEERRGVLEFIPNRYKRGGFFEGMHDRVFSIPVDSPADAIGAAVRRALDLSE